ncbi:MAG TPA: Sec-independent protein translocase protein TatB [Novosphingobium sp.]
MFDVGASELLLIVVVAIVVIGPKDLPLALRTAGRWIGKIRRVSGHFRAGIESMIREAELEEMERKWREQNDAIMKAHPQPAPTAEAGAAGEIVPSSLPPEAESAKHDDRAPQLPLPPV